MHNDTSFITTCTLIVFNCYFLLQVAPVYLLTFLLFLHIYVRPYKYTTQNVIEAVVLFDYCLLFILRSPLSLQELLNPYSGTSIPSHFGTELPSNDSITYFFCPSSTCQYLWALVSVLFGLYTEYGECMYFVINDLLYSIAGVCIIRCEPYNIC